jgi:hypothetical protein
LTVCGGGRYFRGGPTIDHPDSSTHFLIEEEA